MDLVTFTQIASVPVHYDRHDESTGYGYGTRGKPFRPRATKKMLDSLDGCFSKLFAMSAHGTPEVITSAGAYVSKPGHHGLGQAFDLDGLFWSSAFLVAREYPSKPVLYLAVESVLRTHFGTVLAYNYNDAHKDHFHVDLGTAVGFNKLSKSRVEYLQASLFHIHGYQVGIDGVWGPGTQEAVRTAFRDLGLGNGVVTAGSWLEYLELTARTGFAGA